MSAYKLSKYNHYMAYQKERKYLIYNALSNGLAQVEPDVFKLLRSGEDGLDALESDPQRQELLENLNLGNIVVDRDFDETAFLRTKLNMSRFGNSTLSLTIVPTQYCNLDCVYCYEGAKIGRYMDSETEDELVKFAEDQFDRFNYTGLSVSWFGGEPMMHPEAIFSLSRKLIRMCKKRKASYSAMVVTNGTNLNRTLMRKLKTAKIDYIQVTIDGPKEIHDERRPYKADIPEAGNSSFEKICKNVENVLGLLPIHIRINVDKTNQEQSLQLVDWITQRGWLEPENNCHFYIGYTRVWTSNCSDVAGQCFTMQEFSQAELDFQKQLIERGFSLGNLYPNTTSYCVAAAPNGFAIDPRGELYKCWADVGNKKAYLGNVRKPVELNSKMTEWLSYEPLIDSEECRDCSFFPVCVGGCPYAAIEERKRGGKGTNCTPWKTLMRKKMDLFLSQRTASECAVS